MRIRPRKATHITRKNYYLTPEDREEIRKYLWLNQDLTNTFIGDKFGVSRGIVSQLRKELKEKGNK